MIFPSKRLRSRIKTKAFPCLRCGAKTLTFLFWATLYIVVMKMTLLKSSGTQTPRDWSIPDNYTKWLLQGPVLGDDNESDATDDWLEPDNATVIELEKRVVRAQDVCRQRSLQTQDINSKEFFVDHAHNIVWCNIFKAASSTWMYNFNILAGYDKKFLARTRHTPLTLARKKFPRPSEEELRDTITTPGVISLLVVREPFVRLLSAYRDKLENITPPYYRKLARKIVAEHREAATKALGPITSFGPTFREFVAHLISRPAFDEHWAPYHQFCTPCAVNFTVIAKVETLARDSAFVAQRLGLAHVLRRRGRRAVVNKSRDGRDTAALLRRYFGQLDRRMLAGLLAIYGVDFDMFGYDAGVYRRYVRE
nr:carbohydrate sulfotransferase 13 [Vanessa tameamea]